MGCITIQATPVPPPEPVPSSSFKPETPEAYQSMSEIVEMNMARLFPDEDVICGSLTAYHNLRLELIGCRIGNDSTMTSSVAAYHMETEDIEEEWINNFTLVGKDWKGEVIMCVNTYFAYDDYVQDCEYVGLMTFEEFTSRVVMFEAGLKWEYRQRDNALPLSN